MRTFRGRSGWFACVALLLAGCGPSSEMGVAGSNEYRDPEGRFALRLPPDLTVEALGQGSPLLFRNELDDRAVLEGEVLPIHPEALQWTNAEIHQGDLFVAHALWRAQAWCAADGPNETQSCPEIRAREDLVVGPDSLRAIRFEPVLLRERFSPPQRSTSPAGPIWAVLLSHEGTGEVLLLAPTERTLLPPDLEHEEAAIAHSVRVE